MKVNQTDTLKSFIIKVILGIEGWIVFYTATENKMKFPVTLKIKIPLLISDWSKDVETCDNFVT